MNNLWAGVVKARLVTDRVCVFYSGGKDSAVTLDLCARYFPRVDVVFMRLGPVLSFQRACLAWVERRYGIKPHVVPHPMLAEWLKCGTYREPDLDIPIIRFLDVYTYARHLTGTWWIAAGERISDSIIRRAMIKQGGGTINEQRGRFFPIADWSKPDIIAYCKHHKLKVAPEYRTLGFSFRSLADQDLWLIRRHYPEDFEAIRAWFPYCGVGVARYEMGMAL